jgi:hypothetical protein
MADGPARQPYAGVDFIPPVRVSDICKFGYWNSSLGNSPTFVSQSSVVEYMSFYLYKEDAVDSSLYS